MTNADKYKISEVQADKMSDEFAEWHQNNPDVKGYGEALYRFFQAKVKPTLTEDEKVILRNIQLQPIAIGRDEDNDLELKYIEKGIRYDCFPEYNHLFQFIKPRRRI